MRYFEAETTIYEELTNLLSFFQSKFIENRAWSTNGILLRIQISG